MRRGLLALAFIASYLALDWASFIHPLPHYNVTAWNPPPALAIALLMLHGRRWLPAVFAAAVCAEIVVRGYPGHAPESLLAAIVLALGYGVMARALAQGRFAIDPAMASFRDAMRLAVVASVGVLAIGLPYLAALAAARPPQAESISTALLSFWIGDVVGILVTLPLLLMLSVPGRRAQIARLLARGETLALGTAIAASLWVVFGAEGAEQSRRFYVLFLPLIWSAARHGMVGAALATLAIQIGTIAGVHAAGFSAVSVLELQALLIALTLTGFVIGVTVDERRHAAEQLRESLRMAAAGEMAAALAHELHQPLTALSNYASACQKIARTGSAERLEDTLGKLMAESNRAADVVRRLRDFFRSGATDLHPTALAQLADEVVESMRARAAALGVSIERLPAAELPDVLVDRTQIAVVLRNLLANAVEAAAGGGPEKAVRLSIDRSPDGSILTTVTDTGPGVAPESAERIFLPFETTRATGMGLGLPISRAIVEAHGGRLWWQPGAGGIFRFSLPMDAAHG